MEFHTVAEIFQTIDQQRSKLVSAVADLTDERAGFQTAPETWSAAYLVEHLAKTEENLSKVVEKLLAKAEAENITSSGTIEPPVSFAEIGQKSHGQKYQAPEYIRPEGIGTIAESLARLEDSRRKLRALQPRLEAVDLSNAKYPHPAFGDLNLYYWLAFIGVHEARHLKQIEAVLAHN